MRARRGREWRGRSITDIDAIVEQLLELDAKEARAKAIAGCKALGFPADPLDDETIAIWMRTEAALLEADVPAVVTVEAGDGGERRLRFDVPLERSLTAFAEIAKRHAPLVRDGLDGGRPPHRPR